MWSRSFQEIRDLWKGDREVFWEPWLGLFASYRADDSLDLCVLGVLLSGKAVVNEEQTSIELVL